MEIAISCIKISFRYVEGLICEVKNNILSGYIIMIKHRNLDLCLDAEAGLLEAQKGSKRSEIDLQPCSILRIRYQSWIFKRGPSIRSGVEIPGDYISLAFDDEYHLTLQPIIINGIESLNEFVLALQV